MVGGRLFRRSGAHPQASQPQGAQPSRGIQASPNKRSHCPRGDPAWGFPRELSRAGSGLQGQERESWSPGLPRGPPGPFPVGPLAPRSTRPQPTGGSEAPAPGDKHLPRLISSCHQTSLTELPERAIHVLPPTLPPALSWPVKGKAALPHRCAPSMQRGLETPVWHCRPSLSLSFLICKMGMTVAPSLALGSPRVAVSLGRGRG